MPEDEDVAYNILYVMKVVERNMTNGGLVQKWPKRMHLTGGRLTTVPMFFFFKYQQTTPILPSQIHTVTMSHYQQKGPEFSDLDLTMQTGFIRCMQLLGNNRWEYQITNMSDRLHTGDFLYVQPLCSSIPRCPYISDIPPRKFRLGLNIVKKIITFKGPYALILTYSIERPSQFPNDPVWIHTDLLHIPDHQLHNAANGHLWYPNSDLYPA